MSKFYNENKKIVDKRFKKLKLLVNMNAKEMQQWIKDPCSKVASIKLKQVTTRIIRVLKKSKEDWLIRDYNDAGKIISYLSRAKKIKDSIKPASKICLKGKNYYALKNWAFDRNKK
jgi:hypothetical protein